MYFIYIYIIRIDILINIYIHILYFNYPFFGSGGSGKSDVMKNRVTTQLVGHLSEV